MMPDNDKILDLEQAIADAQHWLDVAVDESAELGGGNADDGPNWYEMIDLCSRLCQVRDQLRGALTAEMRAIFKAVRERQEDLADQADGQSL